MARAAFALPLPTILLCASDALVKAAEGIEPSDPRSRWLSEWWIELAEDLAARASELPDGVDDLPEERS
jgi:hypothetical protein